MRSKVLAALVVAALTSNLFAQQQLQVYASLTDGSGAPVAELKPTDVGLLENGVEGKIVKIEPVSRPVKLQLLLDNGLGLGQANMTHLKEGVRGLLAAMPEGVEVTMVTTAPQPRFLVKATTDRQAQLKGLDLLAGDTGTGRFIESLSEATQRIERDKGEYNPVIVAAATTAGDKNFLERDAQRMMQRLQERPTTVHVVIFANGTSASGGANQTQIGLAVTQQTGGRYENINTATHLATLLPEIGAQVAKSHERQTRQFKITADRPSGASGELGKISMRARGGLVVTSLSMDGRAR